MLANIVLPSSTARIIETKLSSVKIISDASLLTSVPVIPIAMPIAAFFKAGASFTPSPVIATTLAFLVKASITRSLWFGETLAYTSTFSTILSNSPSVKAPNSVPVKISPDFRIPNSLAIASAVSLWSPVIIIGFMPAPLQTSIASLASFLGGSIIPTIPTKTISDSTSFKEWPFNTR
ncbi:MAG: hypothetical protein DDT19_02654 [Syntrophomonadaceae bacterium]|nr:hypothetical protein [Bacillota bacterium]